MRWLIGYERENHFKMAGIRTHMVVCMTAAADIWAVVGIGMAFGSGMYIVGIAVTIFIMFMQYIFHCTFKFTKSPTIEQITLRVDPNKNINTILDNAFTSKK